MDAATSPPCAASTAPSRSGPARSTTASSAAPARSRRPASCSRSTTGTTRCAQLRAHLDLDSGYLTPPAAVARTRGLDRRREDRGDRRVRTGDTHGRRPSRARRVRAALRRARREHPDRARRQAATSLVDAMATVDRLLTRLDDRVRRRRPGAPGRARGDAPVPRRARRALPQRVRHETAPSARPTTRCACPAASPLLATLHGEPAALGLLKFHGETTHLKRMWVSRDLRGLGLGRRLLTTLEAHAAEHGIRTVQLETNFALTEAIALYRAAGYAEVPAVQRRAERRSVVREVSAR